MPGYPPGLAGFGHVGQLLSVTTDTIPTNQPVDYTDSRARSVAELFNILRESPEEAEDTVRKIRQIIDKGSASSLTFLLKTFLEDTKALIDRVANGDFDHVTSTHREIARQITGEVMQQLQAHSELRDLLSQLTPERIQDHRSENYINTLALAV